MITTSSMMTRRTLRIFFWSLPDVYCDISDSKLDLSVSPSLSPFFLFFDLFNAACQVVPPAVNADDPVGVITSTCPETLSAFPR